jgi:two-component system phosphate regulon sensor histidine kinase PhoR
MLDLLDAITEETRSLSRQRHQIRLDAEKGLNLLGERDGIRSAFSNLVTNALHYTPEREKVTIRWWRDR